ncbi:protein CYSTEINE-RICH TRANSMEMBRANE MODULE 6-like [Mercurialis annua]|uniref:protein CYSTEINE-RICH TRANSMEMBRANE MODULE 6-like n=1 Tax=Mercurialis annua TaxID=3986 RepID=UPI002160BD82|nr:protein CYSTEINE-RICH TRANSMEMBRANE MODULE 6-like [Mercurialis annua]
MSHYYNQQQSPAVNHPPKVQFVAPPPVGYPMKNGPETGYNPHNQPSAPLETTQRGGCCKGLCAGMCCCCLLDACF